MCKACFSEGGKKQEEMKEFGVQKLKDQKSMGKIYNSSQIMKLCDPHYS